MKWKNLIEDGLCHQSCHHRCQSDFSYHVPVLYSVVRAQPYSMDHTKGLELRFNGGRGAFVIWEDVAARETGRVKKPKDIFISISLYI